MNSKPINTINEQSSSRIFTGITNTQLEILQLFKKVPSNKQKSNERERINNKQQFTFQQIYILKFIFCYLKHISVNTISVFIASSTLLIFSAAPSTALRAFTSPLTYADRSAPIKKTKQHQRKQANKINKMMLVIIKTISTIPPKLNNEMLLSFF